MLKRILLLLPVLFAVTGVSQSAEAQYHHPYHRHHRHCVYRHGRRFCR